jgi:glutamate synthase domain-containing protein 1
MSNARLLDSRRKLQETPFKYIPQEAEGGCGVVGLVASRPIRGSHILSPLQQMHNRGNGKGGGISAVGLVPEQLGVDKKTLEQDYLVQVAYLKDDVREELEKEFILSTYDVHSSHRVANSDDPALLARLEVTPPVVHRYFCRVKKDVLDRFIQENSFNDVDRRHAEDEVVYQTSFRINKKYYAGATMSAFVMSHGRNMLIMKIVGYAEDVIHYYKLEDFQAHMWIGHQRYPTKGRVWHPGGAQPFMGLDEALVHNGDFANYYSVTEYLGQKGITPLFMTDTEVSILFFDLLNRVYGYPL